FVPAFGSCDTAHCQEESRAISKPQLCTPRSTASQDALRRPDEHRRRLPRRNGPRAAAGGLARQRVLLLRRPARGDCLHALDQKGRLLLRGRRVPQERADHLRRPAVVDAPRDDVALVRVRVPLAPTTAADTPAGPDAAAVWWVSGSHADAALAAAAYDAARGEGHLGAARPPGRQFLCCCLQPRQAGDDVRGEGAGGLRLRGRGVPHGGEDGVCRSAAAATAESGTTCASGFPRRRAVSAWRLCVRKRLRRELFMRGVRRGEAHGRQPLPRLPSMPLAAAWPWRSDG
ncbi:Uncharacterized protein TCAP_05747, partial [Tolypocladium capitatum]